MTTREELAAVLAEQFCEISGSGRMCEIHDERTDPETGRCLRALTAADALLASPALARVTREAKAEAWAEEHSKDCMFVEEGCYIHENPYRDQTEEPLR